MISIRKSPQERIYSKPPRISTYQIIQFRSNKQKYYTRINTVILFIFYIQASFAIIDNCTFTSLDDVSSGSFLYGRVLENFKLGHYAPKSMWRRYFARGIYINFWNAQKNWPVSVFLIFSVRKLITCLIFEMSHFFKLEIFEMPHFRIIRSIRTNIDSKMGHFKNFELEKVGHFKN